MGGGKKGGAQRIPPFNRDDKEKIIDPLSDLIGGEIPGIDIDKIQQTIKNPDALESSAAGALTGPQGGASFLQGGAGNLGTAGGLFGQAAQAATADPTNVLQDPVTQQLLAANTSGAQQFLNKNLGQIGASSQRASGGVGSGSGETAARTRATTQAGEALSRQNAQTLFGEQARLQDRQLQQAGLLGNLGSGLGQLGLGQGGLGSQLLGQQIGLGGTFQGRNVGAEMFPLEQLFRLGDLLKSSSGVRQPGFMEQLGSLLGGAGSAAEGAVGLAALSDKRAKEDSKEAVVEVAEFLDDLEAYDFKYKSAPKRHVGIMAQDAERTKMGSGFVVDTDKGKMIHLGLGFGAVLASLAEINKRLKALEGENGE